MRYRKVILLISVLSLLAVGRFDTAFDTGMADAQLFDYFGEQMLSGAVLYKDIWDIKPPGIFYINALINVFSPDSFIGHAVVEFIVLIVCLIPIYLIVLRFADQFSALISVLLFALLTTLDTFNQGGNLTELYVVAGSACAAYLFAIGDTRRLLFLSGICVGMASFFKLNGIGILLCMLVYLFIYSVRSRTFIAGLCKASYLMLGFFGFWLLSYFLVTEQFMEMINVSFIYPFEYASNSAFSLKRFYLRLNAKVGFLWPLAYFYIVGCLLAVISISLSTKKCSERDFLLVFVVGWSVCDVLGILAGGRMYGHYFMLSFASLSVLVGFIHYNLRRIFALRIITIGVLCSIICIISYNAMRDLKYTNFTFSVPSNEISCYLAKHSESGDIMYVMPYKPYYYNDANLPAASRYTTTVNLIDSRNSNRIIGAAIIQDLRKVKPKFVIFDARKNRYDTDFYITFSWFISESYNEVLTIKDDVLFRLR